MPYRKNPPTYDALQWTGDNLNDVLDFANIWNSCYPGESAQYNAETNQIVTCMGHTLNVGDWIVTPGYWHPQGNRADVAEVISNEVFQVKYSELP